MARYKEFNIDDAIDRAIDLFWRHGYERTSLKDLLDHLEIGRASFYNAFGDKHKLFMLALRRYLERTDETTIIQALQAETSRLATIEKIFQQVIESLANDPLQRGCFIINSAIEVAPADEEVAVLVADHAQRCEDALYDALYRAQNMQEIRQTLDLRATARFLLSTIRGMRVTGRLTHDRRVFEDIAETALTPLHKNEH